MSDLQAHKSDMNHLEKEGVIKPKWTLTNPTDMLYIYTRVEREEVLSKIDLPGLLRPKGAPFQPKESPFAQAYKRDRNFLSFCYMKVGRKSRILVYKRVNNHDFKKGV